MGLDLDTYLPLRLAILSDKLTVSGRNAYAQLDLVPGVARMVLVLAERPDSTPAELTRTIGIDKGAVSRTLRMLEEQGLVSVSARGKRSLYRLSPEGEALHEKLLPIAISRERRLVAGLSDNEVATLVDLLRRVHANLTGQTVKG